jgi:hypothetical protein
MSSMKEGCVTSQTRSSDDAGLSVEFLGERVRQARSCSPHAQIVEYDDWSAGSRPALG